VGGWCEIFILIWFFWHYSSCLFPIVVDGAAENYPRLLEEIVDFLADAQLEVTCCTSEIHNINTMQLKVRLNLIHFWSAAHIPEIQEYIFTV
jgi:hypothetical protein